MKIAVLSDTRRPTRSDGHHGLGKTVHDIASGLARLGHDVTLYAGEGSQFDKLVVDASESQRANRLARSGNPYDVILDSTHYHDLSRLQPAWAILNRIGDTECDYAPPNATVESCFMQTKCPPARVIRKGIDVDAIPFFAEAEHYAVYMSQLIGWKGLDNALELARQTNNVRFAGHNTYDIQDIPNYYGVVTGWDKWQLLGKASCIIHPSLGDASPRLPLEASACGVPTLCYADGGSAEHVADGVTGFVCDNLLDMREKMDVVSSLDRTRIREWVATNHRLKDMLLAYESALLQVADGVRW